MEGSVSRVPVVNRTPISTDAFRDAMRAQTDQMLDQVMTAVNNAPDGAWIKASEMTVRSVLEEYRRRVFERALQLKCDAAEGAFSPGGPANGPPSEE